MGRVLAPKPSLNIDLSTLAPPRAEGTGMTRNASPVEKLREYIREITPQARALLLRELERGAIDASNFPGFELILQELREEQRNSSHHSERLDSPDRRFFQLLTPFLVDDEVPDGVPGRINRAALGKIWTWLERDLLPQDIKTFSEEIRSALAMNNIARADQITREFQARAISAMASSLQQNGSEPKNWQRLISQLGGNRNVQAIKDVIAIVQVRDVLAGVLQHLPQQIRNLTDTELSRVRALFQHQALQRKEVFQYAIILLFSRLAIPSHLLRLAVSAAKTNSAERIRETPYAFAVDLIFDEIARLAARLARDLSARSISDACLGIIKIHDLVHGLTTELDIPAETRWAKKLTQLRTETSSLLRSHIDGLTGQVRKILCPRPKEEVIGSAVMDRHQVAIIEASLDILIVCRMCADEIVLNEITTRVSIELETCLDTAIQALLDFRAPSIPFGSNFSPITNRSRGSIFGESVRETLFRIACENCRYRYASRASSGAGLIAALRPRFFSIRLLDERIAPHILASVRSLRHRLMSVRRIPSGSIRRYNPMTRRQRRLALVGTALAILSLAAALALSALRDSVVFFVSPSELIAKQPVPGKRLRIGGLVKEGSIVREGISARFAITDGNADLPVVYQGILPDLFREQQGVVAEGKFDAGGIFQADNVLAKHDERYMPREVADALKKQGLWNEGQGAKPK